MFERGDGGRRLQITYPDEWHDYQQPQQFELERLSPRLCRLRMTLLLSAEQWAESSDIRLRCGLLTACGADETTRAVAPLPYSAAYAATVTAINNGDSEALRIAAPTALARRRPTPAFVALPDAGRPLHANGLSVRVYPISRC